MGPCKDSVRILWIEGDRPYTAAWQLHLIGIHPSPTIAGVRRDKDAAVGIDRTGDNDLVRVVRVDKDTREISQREIAAAPRPRLTIVTA